MKSVFRAVLGTTAAAAAVCGLYALSIRGSRNHPDLELLRKYRYAHRGYHDKPQIPENSLPAFRRAIERGWGAELDVHLLKDGTLAVFHDSDLRRCTGESGMIEDLTLEQMKQLHLEETDEQIPTFDEVLALFEDATPLIIELKSANGNHNALAEAVCRRLDRYSGSFCIESFDPRVLHAVRKLRPGICLGQLAENFFHGDEPLPVWQKAALSNLMLNFLSVPDFIAYNFADSKNPSLQTCLKLWGTQEVSWTIRSKADLDACEALGAIPIFEKFDPDL